MLRDERSTWRRPRPSGFGRLRPAGIWFERQPAGVLWACRPVVLLWLYEPRLVRFHFAILTVHSAFVFTVLNLGCRFDSAPSVEWNAPFA
jgi:hypothetical protein